MSYLWALYSSFSSSCMWLVLLVIYSQLKCHLHKRPSHSLKQWADPFVSLFKWSAQAPHLLIIFLLTDIQNIPNNILHTVDPPEIFVERRYQFHVQRQGVIKNYGNAAWTGFMWWSASDLNQETQTRWRVCVALAGKGICWQASQTEFDLWNPWGERRGLFLQLVLYSTHMCHATTTYKINTCLKQS